VLVHHPAVGEEALDRRVLLVEEENGTAKLVFAAMLRQSCCCFAAELNSDFGPRVRV
jgi:hypothetical protein